MRILFLVGRDPAHPQAGGGDIQAWAWAKWAVRRGHTVTYVCLAAANLPRAETVDGIHVLRLGRGVHLALETYDFYRKRRTDFDLIYEDPVGAGRVPYLSPVWARVPVVAVWHQVTAQLLHAMYPWPIAKGLAISERFLARVYRRCHLWVPSSERASEVVSSLGFLPERVHVISPTLDAPQISPIGTGFRDHAVVFLGVIRRYKAIEHLIEAFSKLTNDLGEARLIIAGRRMDNGYERELRELVARLGISHKVEFRLDVSDSTKNELLEGARVLVLPSLLEGFGIVVLEANAHGTPVIASSGVPAAAVVEGTNGLRYRYGDTDELARALLRLLEDDGLWASLSRSSRAYSQTFDESRVGMEFEAMLGQALAQSVQRP